MTGQHTRSESLFGRIVDLCISAGLVNGEHMSVDGSFTPANANRLHGDVCVTTNLRELCGKLSNNSRYSQKAT